MIVKKKGTSISLVATSSTGIYHVTLGKFLSALYFNFLIGQMDSTYLTEL